MFIIRQSSKNKLEEDFTSIGRKPLDGSGNSFYSDILSGSSMLDSGNNKYSLIDKEMLGFCTSNAQTCRKDYEPIGTSKGTIGAGLFIEQAQSMTLIFQMSKFDPNAKLKLEVQLVNGSLPEFDYEKGLAELKGILSNIGEELRQEKVRELDVTNYESPYAMGSRVIISPENIKVNVDYKLKSSDIQVNEFLPFYFFPEKVKSDGKLTQTYITFGGETGVLGILKGEVELGIVSSSSGRVNPYITLNGGVGLGAAVEVPIKAGVKETKGQENPHSLSGIDKHLEMKADILTPWQVYSFNGSYDRDKEYGIGIGASGTGSGSLTIVIPSIKDISEFSVNLFIDSEKGQQFIRDAENDISKLKINLK